MRTLAAASAAVVQPETEDGKRDLVATIRAGADRRLFRGAWRGGCPIGTESIFADGPADGDDGVGEVEERVDDGFAALVAVLEAVEAVVPGVGALDVPALPGLDRGLAALVRDFAFHAAGRELAAGLVRGRWLS
jgi:hypothetical protein